MELSSLIRATMASPPPLYDSKGEEMANVASLYQNIKRFLSGRQSAHQPIGIMLPKEPPYILFMLACMEMGIPYVPLKEGTPNDRIQDIVEDADIQAIITRDDLERIYSHAFSEQVQQDVQLEPFLPLYVIFTSGSTGRPKGVAISRGAFIAYSDWLVNYLGDAVSSQDPVLQITEFTFDISLIDVILYLRKRTPLHFTGFNNAIFKLAQEIADKKITTLSTVPNNINMLLDDFIVKKADMSSLQNIMIGGARFSSGLYQKVKQYFLHRNVHNFYGPTEFTIYSHAKKITFNEAEDTRDHNVSIGVANTAVHPEILIDSRFASAFEKGELVLAGKQIMNGYVNNREKTQQVLCDIAGDTYYRTGDLAYKDDKNEFFIVGRLDDTIKYRGYRINLLDIDSYIARLPYVQDVTTIAIPDEIRENLTVCYIILKQEWPEEITARQVKTDLREILLDYQIPEKVFFIHHFPTNASGKVCKKTLAQQYRNATQRQ